MGKGKKKFCQCSPDCREVVKTAGRKYAHGHNPSSKKLPILDLRRTMTAEEYARYAEERKAVRGNHAVVKRFVQCPYGCGYSDGVRAMQRHRKTCPNSPRRSPEAWSAYIQERYNAKKAKKKTAA